VTIEPRFDSLGCKASPLSGAICRKFADSGYGDRSKTSEL